MYGSRFLVRLMGIVVLLALGGTVMLAGCKKAPPEASNQDMRAEKMKGFMQGKMKAGKSDASQGAAGE